jgi:hypothetical protein
MKKFRNSGQYIGGSTCLTRYDKSWFSKGSTERRRKKPTIYAPAVEPLPRSPEEQAEYEAFKRDYYKGGEWRIVKADAPITPSKRKTSGSAKQNPPSENSPRGQVQGKSSNGG